MLKVLDLYFQDKNLHTMFGKNIIDQKMDIFTSYTTQKIVYYKSSNSTFPNCGLQYTTNICCEIGEDKEDQLTCDLISNEFAGLHLPDGGEERPDLLLGHRLGQVVDDEVGLRVLGRGARLHRVVHVSVLLRGNRGRVHSVHRDH